MSECEPGSTLSLFHGSTELNAVIQILVLNGSTELTFMGYGKSNKSWYSDCLRASLPKGRSSSPCMVKNFHFFMFPWTASVFYWPEFLATERRCIVLPVRYELNLYMLYRYTIFTYLLRGLSRQANYTDRATAACRRSLVPISADRGCHVVSVTDPYDRILGFLDRVQDLQLCKSLIVLEGCML
jgi:hypothetical protein